MKTAEQRALAAVIEDLQFLQSLGLVEVETMGDEVRWRPTAKAIREYGAVPSESTCRIKEHSS